MSSYYAAFDTETGGLNPKDADVLTFYMAMVDENFKIVDEINLKLKPNDGRWPITHEGALRVNKINVEQHMADPETVDYKTANKLILAMARKYLKKRGRYSNLRPLGQNVPFDLGMTWEHIINKDEWDSVFHYKVADTAAATDFLKDAGWFPKEIGSLESIVDYLQLPKRGAHNAREDTLMCVDVYKRLIEIMASKKENSSEQDIISLLEAE